MIQHVLFRHDFEINNQNYIFNISKYKDKFIIYGLVKVCDINNLVTTNIPSILKIIKSCDNKNDRQIIEQAIFEYLI